MSYLEIGATGGGAEMSFEEGLEAAQDALSSLAFKGQALATLSTNSTQQGIGEQVLAFATGGGARGLQRAAENRDVVKLRDLQRSMDNIASIANEELRDAAVRRFVMGVIHPALAFIPPSAGDAIDAIAQNPVPGFPPPDNDWEFYLKVGMGLLAMVSVAYTVRAFK